eukprot:2287967-Pyramimonas_sp.AAC.1
MPAAPWATVTDSGRGGRPSDHPLRTPYGAENMPGLPRLASPQRIGIPSAPHCGVEKMPRLPRSPTLAGIEAA